MSGWNSWFDPLQASSVQADDSESEHEPVPENHSGHDGGYTKEDELETYEKPAYAGSSALIGAMNVKRMQSSVGNSGISQWMKNSGGDILQQHLPISDSSTAELGSLDGWDAIHSLLFSLRYSRTTDLVQAVWLNAIRAFEKLQPASQTQALEQLLAELRALEVAQQQRILTGMIELSPTDKNSLLISSLIRSMLSQFNQPEATSPDATGDEQ